MVGLSTNSPFGSIVTSCVGLLAYSADLCLCRPATCHPDHTGSQCLQEADSATEQEPVPWSLARSADCAISDSACLASLNESAGADQVPFSLIEELVAESSTTSLHAGAISNTTWLRRFSDGYCKTWTEKRFPNSTKEAAMLKALIDQQHDLEVIAVYYEAVHDGIGARVKKLVELVAASLHIGFAGVATAMGTSGGMIHPKDWPWGMTWCHESPSLGPEPGQGELAYPEKCWAFDVQRDVLGQSAVPEKRTLLWGHPDSPVLSMESSGEQKASQFHCINLVYDENRADTAWKYHKRKTIASSDRAMQLLFSSARSFAAPSHVLPGRHEAQCGYGVETTVAPASQGSFVHVAIHIRRGDVGENSGYAVNQQLQGAGFSRWLCGLAAALELDAGQQLMLHVFTESFGLSRAAWRRAALRGTMHGIRFSPQAGDDMEPLYHTMAELEVLPTCEGVSPKVHMTVNNNPRDAIQCMIRSDILVTSFSSLGWAASVLHSGLVFHPDDGERDKWGGMFHWDLRDQYLDWAQNWFRISDVWTRGKQLRKVYSAAADLDVMS